MSFLHSKMEPNVQNQGSFEFQCRTLQPDTSKNINWPDTSRGKQPGFEVLSIKSIEAIAFCKTLSLATRKMIPMAGKDISALKKILPLSRTIFHAEWDATFLLPKEGVLSVTCLLLSATPPKPRKYIFLYFNIFPVKKEKAK